MTPTAWRHLPPRLVSLIFVLVFAGSLPAQTPAPTQAQGREGTLKSATEAAERIEKATGATPDQPRLPTGDPCQILPLADVRKVFPAAKAGERSRRLEKYGSTECAWKDGNGGVVIAVQESYSSGSAEEDVRGMIAGFVDPLDPAARAAVRVERMAGIGDEAAAFIERADPARKILSDGALLSTRRGEHTIWLMTDQLSSRDRAEALKSLGDLGRTAAKRL
jgi:hypothetical protein